MRRTPFCKQARATGACNTEGCKDRHDLTRCMPCGRFIPSPQMEAHAQGPTHIRNAAKLPEPTPPPTSGHGQRPESSGGVRNAHVDEPRAASPSGAPSLRVLTILIARCDICSVYLDVADSETHAAGRRHRELATRRAAGLPSPAPAPDLKHCDTCNDDFPSSAFKSHVRSRNHLSTQKFTDLARDALVDEGPTDRAPRASSARSGSNAEGASDRAERRETADGGRAGDPPMPSLIAGLPKVLSTGRLCDLCCVYTSKDGFEDHITGKQHQEARERKLSGARTPAPPPRAIYCRACNHHYHPNRHERHISHSQHINRQRWLDEALEKVETVGQATSQPSLHGDERYVADDNTPSEDTSRTEPLPEIDPGKIGLSVSCAEGVDFGVLEEHNDGQEWTSSMKTTTITLDKHTRDLPVSFVRAQIYSRAEVEDSLPYFSASLHGDSPWIKRGHQRIVVVAFTPHYEGLFEGTLELVFYHGGLKREFSVFRTLKGVAGSIQDRIYLASPEPTATGPTLAGKKKPYVAPSTYIPLMPPPRSRGKRSRRLPQYEPPNAIVDAMQSPEYDQVLAPALVAEMLPGTLSMETYQQWFETFVWIEEGQN
ncbi:hypothetical protein OF83DRAFT_291965 [Amylostereum chailletii]|nr:hypothetical protein OF83DRAFT_291965 [Amylostereum chailletii]